MDEDSESTGLLHTEEKVKERKPGLCVLRPYKRGDYFAIMNLIERAAMETVGDYFWSAVFSEIFPQMAFVAMAIGFVALGLPVFFCVSLIPVAVVLLYVIIWSAHRLKVTELHSDLFDIAHSYRDDPDTGFWVAEVHDVTESSELAAHFNKQTKVRYEFIDQDTLDRRGTNLADYRQHTVVACIAITRSTNTASRAWLRRFTVMEEYRRRNIASNLLDLVIKFTREKNYRGIELVTTQCHHTARNMYLKEGFEVNMNMRYFMNVSQALYQFSLTFPKPVVVEKTSVVKEGEKTSKLEGEKTSGLGLKTGRF